MQKKNKKQRIPRLTEAQYGAYLSALKEEEPSFLEGAQTQAIAKEEQERKGD